jgi:hypothetical protein
MARFLAVMSGMRTKGTLAPIFIGAKKLRCLRGFL